MLDFVLKNISDNNNMRVYLFNYFKIVLNIIMIVHVLTVMHKVTVN